MSPVSLYSLKNFGISCSPVISEPLFQHKKCRQKILFQFDQKNKLSNHLQTTEERKRRRIVPIPLSLYFNPIAFLDNCFT